MNPIITLAAAAVIAASASAQEPLLTPKTLEAAIAANSQGADAERLADRVRQAFGGREALLRGPQPLIDETTIAWAIELPGWQATPAMPAPRVWRPVGNAGYAMTPVGTTGVYALVRTFAHGDGFAWLYEAGPNWRLGGGNTEVYRIHPDSRPHPGVPKGVVRQMPAWRSTVYPGTMRDWWIYLPAQLAQDAPAALMVFQDGANWLERAVPAFDNLIAQGAMPPTVGVFVEPGGLKAPRDNRMFEYDTLSDQYVRFLLDEILPEVGRVTTLRQDAAGRAIAGGSSGAVAAFTAAWERPDAFSKVLSSVGSFTNIAYGDSLRGGAHNYEALVRRVPRKPIRVFLQDGENDLDNIYGSWWLANQTLAKSLAFAGYDYQFVTGQGFHTGDHMRAIFPDALRWLWRDWKQELPSR